MDKKYEKACVAKSILPGGQFSAYRYDAERAREEVAGAIPGDLTDLALTLDQWRKISQARVDYFDDLATRHEQAILEGKGHEFIYGNQNTGKP